MSLIANLPFLPPLIQTRPKVIERGAIRIQGASIHPNYTDGLRREVQHLPELYFLLPDLFLGGLAFGDVGHSPDNLAIAGCTLHRVSDRLDVLDSPVSQQQAGFMFEVSAVLRCAIDDLLCKRPVPGMYAVHCQIQCWRQCAVVLEDAIGFGGPDNCSALRFPSETACVTEPLGFGQVCFAAPDVLSQELVLRDIDPCSDEPLDPAVCRWRADAPYMTNRSVRAHDPLREVESSMLGQRRLNFLRDQLPIVRMYEREIFLGARRFVVWIHAINREQLGRPLLETGGIECPAAVVRQPLSLRQVELGLLAFLDIEIHANPIQ